MVFRIFIRLALLDWPHCCSMGTSRKAEPRRKGQRERHDCGPRAIPNEVQGAFAGVSPWFLEQASDPDGVWRRPDVRAARYALASSGRSPGAMGIAIGSYLTALMAAIKCLNFGDISMTPDARVRGLVRESRSSAATVSQPRVPDLRIDCPDQAPVWECAWLARADPMRS